MIMKFCPTRSAHITLIRERTSVRSWVRWRTEDEHTHGFLTRLTEVFDLLTNSFLF